MAASKLLSVVVSVYNEEDALPAFYRQVCHVLKDCAWDHELIFVDDGSTDGSLALLKGFAEADPRVRILSFSRNFGHEAAMLAGIDHTQGDGVVCMDADLQHPPQSIPEIIEKLDAGFEVISMVRRQNAGAGPLKRLGSWLFYKMLNALSPVRFEPNFSDFFAVSRRVAQILRKDYREKVRYLRGFVQSVGFQKAVLEYRAPKRAAGQSKYSSGMRLGFAINVLCSFSDLPLKLGIYSGCAVGILGLIIMIYSIIVKFVSGAPSGYTTIVVALCFLFAVTLFVIGIIGQYISVLFSEIKDRPIYILSETVNLQDK